MVHLTAGNHAWRYDEDVHPFPLSLIAAGLTQVCWVVPDIQASEQVFRETLGIPRFFKLENIRAQDVAGTYRGQPADWEFHLYLAYAGETQIELIQPLSGRSMYQDFLDQHGPGVQHIATAVPEGAYEEVTAALQRRGHELLQGFRLPVATVGYFDTYATLGVVTEIIGLTDGGQQLFDQIKRGDF